jgi:hypothetical protein
MERVKGYYNINGTVKHTKDFTYDDLKFLYLDFQLKNGRLPVHKDFTFESNLPNPCTMRKVLAKYEKTTSEFYSELGYKDSCHHNETDEEYKLELDKLKEICKNLDAAPHHLSLSQKYGLKGSRWFVEHCKNSLVHDYNSFLEFEVGIKPNYLMSKELLTKYIYDYQEKLDRPLKASDFNGNTFISKPVIQRIWGTYTNMKKELGLEVIMENMFERKTNLEEIKIFVKKTCERILQEENRTKITLRDLNKYEKVPSWTCCTEHFRKHDLFLRDYLETIGFTLIEAGRGLNYEFEDGEKTTSQYELLFSNFLRKNNINYNDGYFRNIRYSKIIPDYKGYMDCDYLININNKEYYIEIAGLLRDYKSWYYEDRELNSKSRENYRVKLKEKEKMLKENGINCYLFFPSDLKNEYLSSWITNL